MGFIERKEKEREEELRKWREKEQKEKDNRKELLAQRDLQEAVERKAKEVRTKLRVEAEEQFTASGLGVMLDRLEKVNTIRGTRSNRLADERPYSFSHSFQKGDWLDDDGLFHVSVTVSDERRDRGGYKYVNKETFFDISCDSTGLIAFDYGSNIFHHKELSQSVWGKNLNLLEELLETAIRHPKTRRTEGQNSPPESQGFGGAS